MFGGLDLLVYRHKTKEVSFPVKVGLEYHWTDKSCLKIYDQYQEVFIFEIPLFLSDFLSQSIFKIFIQFLTGAKLI